MSETFLAARDWQTFAAALSAVALGVTVLSYRRAGSTAYVRAAAGVLKATGVVALAVCLVEPLRSGVRPRPGSNLFLVLADNSRSLAIHDPGKQRSRGDELRQLLTEKSAWQERLAVDFDVRSYAFDDRLRAIDDFSQLTLDGDSSAMAGSLAVLAQRYRGKPIAGILMFTDGNATDLADGEHKWTDLPPVYPVVLGSDEALADVSVTRVAVSQTNFEAAPVTIAAEVDCRGLDGRPVVVRVLDEDGKECERRTVKSSAPSSSGRAPTLSGRSTVERFQLRPERPGVSFYTVVASLEGEEALDDDDSPARGSQARGKARTDEATLENNRRLVVVDRGGGPYRVLYVGGRPNWEFKFLRRAATEDDELNLVGLLRIARREPKFTFRGRPGERTNPLYRGFGNQADEQAEQYDEPVLLRLGTEDADELRGGFPKSEEDLFRYHALIFDDVEAGFFSHEQMSLVQQFVSRRGGGFLMLGGRESFAKGGYNRTPIGEVLPVYLDRPAAFGGEGGFRLALSREGWLQPWVRVRSTEPEEEKRLAEMPSFKSANRLDAIKPGATVLASIETADGAKKPALVVQSFGRGRAAALVIGDLWRWHLRRKAGTESDLDKSWRQTVRWLVADVPQRVEVVTQRPDDAAGRGVRIAIRARDEHFEPLDDASVAVRVKTPDGREIELTAEPSERRPGEYETTFAARTPGAYRATVIVKAADASEIGRREAGWTVERATDELRTLRPNRELLGRLAEATQGELVAAHRLDGFVADLPNRKVPIVEAWTYPLWHQWPVFLFAVGCLVGEWGLRRWNAMP
jgi:uncharacterized membrane protein